MLFGMPQIPPATAARVRCLSEKGRLPQSVMLTGGSESLREKCALELAAAVICENKKNGDPCGKCPACRKIKAGTHPDVIPVRPQKDKKSVTVDAVRELVLDSLYIAPNEASDKVYVFYDAGEMSVIIQNTLLKTIEEPPPFAMFVFLCEQRESLLSTVVSRVTEFSLGASQPAARGRGADDTETAALGVMNALVYGGEYDLMKSTAPLAKNRLRIRAAAEKLAVYVRDAAARGVSPPLGGSEEAAALLARAFDLKTLCELRDLMGQIAAWAKGNANENLLLTIFSSKLAEIQKKRR